MINGLSYDHRLVDGAQAVTFLVRVKERLLKICAHVPGGAGAMAAERYDLAAIGAGPSCYVAAVRAVQRTLLAGAHARVAAHAVAVGELSLSLPAKMRRKEQVVRALSPGVAALFKGNRITVLQGRVRIAAPGRVTVERPDTVVAARILIANRIRTCHAARLRI